MTPIPCVFCKGWTDQHDHGYTRNTRNQLERVKGKKADEARALAAEFKAQQQERSRKIEEERLAKLADAPSRGLAQAAKFVHGFFNKIPDRAKAGACSYEEIVARVELGAVDTDYYTPYSQALAAGIASLLTGEGFEAEWWTRIEDSPPDDDSGRLEVYLVKAEW